MTEITGYNPNSEHKLGFAEGRQVWRDHKNTEDRDQGYDLVTRFGARILLGENYSQTLAENPKRKKLVGAYFRFSVYLNEIVDRQKHLTKIDRKKWLWELNDRYRELAHELDQAFENEDQRQAVSTTINDIVQTEQHMLKQDINEISSDEAFQYREKINAANVAAISTLLLDDPEIYQKSKTDKVDDRYHWLKQPQSENEEKGSIIYYASMAMQIIDDWNHREADQKHDLITPALIASKQGMVKGRMIMANKLLEYCHELDKYIKKPALLASLAGFNLGLKAFEFLFRLLPKTPRIRHTLVKDFFGLGKMPGDEVVSVLGDIKPKIDPMDIYFVDGKYDARTPEDIVAGKPPVYISEKPEQIDVN